MVNDEKTLNLTITTSQSWRRGKYFLFLFFLGGGNTHSRAGGETEGEGERKS